MIEPLTCPQCGSSNQDPAEVGSWRWNGMHWEHKCGGLDPQCGHFVVNTVGLIYRTYLDYCDQVGDTPSRGQKAHRTRLWHRYCIECVKAGIDPSHYSLSEANP